MTTTTWRTHTGAEYDDVRQIPCFVIANGYLVDVDETHPELAAEIERRGRAVYRDHGYGESFRDGPVCGCDHSRTGEERARALAWFHREAAYVAPPPVQAKVVEILGLRPGDPLDTVSTDRLTTAAKFMAAMRR